MKIEKVLAKLFNMSYNYLSCDGKVITFYKHVEPTVG